MGRDCPKETKGSAHTVRADLSPLAQRGGLSFWLWRALEHFEARCRYLQMADKAQRTLAILTERLDRHRGAGQQQITVKHVTVNADNAIVGDVNQTPGVGPPAEMKGQPHALGHAIQPALWSENPQRESLPVAGDAERALPDARRPIPGRPERK